LTDVLDRLDTAELTTYDAPATRPAADDQRPRIAIAALSAAAAAIHLAMVPAHMGEWTLEGAGFLASAWAQLLVAFYAVTRPSKRVWWFALASNAAFVAASIVSRTSGFPFGPQKDIAEKMTVVDGACVLFEIAVVFGALAMLLLPLKLRASRSRLFAPLLPLVVLALTTGVLASPSARNHAHGHDHGDVVLPAGMVNRGFGSFMNGHSHTHVNVPLDPGTQQALDHQLDITRELAAEFPTLQDAVDAGYRRAGPYVPGLGTHMIKFEGGAYLNADGVLDDDELRHPLSLQYLGTDPDAELGGFMYYAATSFEPEGFVGRNDSWHYHEDLCAVMNPDGLLDFPYGPDFGATKAQCDTVHGNLLDSQYMVHVWTVPGWDDMDRFGGVFAETNPGFGCSDGTWFSLPNDEWIDHLTNVCRTGEAGQPDF
jgi:hypothetical protein